MHTTKSLKDLKIISYFHKKTIKKICISMHFFALIISLLKLWELGLYFKNIKKFILFSFSIWDYELIHKIYSRY